MSDEWMDRLSDYLDGEMSPAERALLEGHLAEDAECTAVLESLRRVKMRAASLDDKHPAHAQQMWRGIAQRIGATPPQGEKDPAVAGVIRPWRTRRFSVSVPQLVAAGIAMMLLSGGGSLVFRGAAERSAALRGGMADQAAVVPEVMQAGFGSVAITRLDEAVADLVQVLEEEREFLNPETVRIIEENLAIIDRAIERSRQALMQDPESDYLRGHLEQTMRQKLTLLRRVTTISRAL